MKSADAERIAFEAWHLTQNENGNVLGGPYENPYLNAMWAAWQARAALANRSRIESDASIASREPTR
jgi:hypothetical protein